MPKEVVVIFQRLLNRRQNDKGKVRSPDGNRHDNKRKKMEQKIMVCIPLGILIYLRMTTQGFVDVLYGNVLGIIVMTLCLIIYAAAAVISIRIVDIKV